MSTLHLFLHIHQCIPRVSSFLQSQLSSLQDLFANTYTNAKILRGMGRSGLTPLEKFKLVKLLKIGLGCSWQTKLSLRTQMEKFLICA